MAIDNRILKPSGVIQLRSGTQAAMSAENPLLSRREIAVEIDTEKIKVGNGSDRWNDLPYAENSMNLPDNDSKVYVMKNGTWTQAVLVEKPSELLPEIYDTGEIVIAVDEDMTAYQFTGYNTEVNI